MAGREGKTRQIGLGLERLGLVALGAPVISIVLVLVLSALALMGMNRLKVDDSLTELFRADTPEFHRYERLTQKFPSSEFDVLVVVEGEDLLTREGLDALSGLAIELQFIDAMRGLVSIFSAREPAADSRIPPPLFPEKWPEGEAFERLLDRVRSNEIIRGKLLSPDGELTLLVMALDREVVLHEGLEDVIGTIQNTVDTQLEGTGLRAKLSGAPVMQYEIRNAVERDRLVYNGLGFLVGALIAIVFFRRVSLMVIAAGPPAIAILWSLGALGWLDFRLNLFLSVMSPLIMVMAFSDTMQITFAVRDRLLAGDTRREALRYGILTVGPACVLTVATAAASFITLTLSDSALIRTFGAAGALSTLIAYVSVITLVPLLGLVLLRNEGAFASKRDGEDRAMDLLRDLCGWIADRVVARPLTFTVIGLALLTVFGAAHLTLEPRYRLADQVPDRDQALEATERLDTKLTGANPIHVMIELPKDRSLFEPATLALIGTVHEIVASQPKVGNVWSIETLRRWLEQAARGGIEALQQYVDMLPQHLVSRFVTPARDAVVVTGRVPDVDANELRPAIERIEGALKQIKTANPDFRIAVTGLPAIAALNSGQMITQLNYGLTAEMVFVAALIGLAFRSVFIAFVSALPGLFPIFAAGMLLALAGEGLQFASIVALTVAFGLGLDATIHYLNRLRLEDRPDEDPAVGVKRATILIGPALMLTTIVLAFGLAVTMFSDLPSLRLFGRLCAITLTAALIGDLMILPATILLVRRYVRGRRMRRAAAAGE